MVSWLTHIRGSSGNSIRNRWEICCGDHQSLSHWVIWAASREQDSFGILGRLACARAR